MDLLSLSQKKRYDCQSNVSESTRDAEGTFANLRTLKLAELELLHDLVPDNVGCCEEPATTARLLIGDGPSLEFDFGVKHMWDGNLGFTGSQSGLYVAVGQDGAAKLDLWIGSCSGFPGVNVDELDGAIAGLGY